MELGGEVWGKWGVSAAVVVLDLKPGQRGHEFEVEVWRGQPISAICGEDSSFQQGFQVTPLRIHIFTTMKQAAALLALATTAAANHDYTVSDLISGNFTVTTNDITMGT